MATKPGTSSSRSETGARAGNMPLLHHSKTYKFGLMGHAWNNDILDRASEHHCLVAIARAKRYTRRITQRICPDKVIDLKAKERKWTVNLKEY